MTKIDRMDVDMIHVSERQRKINPERVEALAASIREIGLKTPISIRMVEEMHIEGEGEVHGVPVLVTGAHRLEAMKALGRSEIECIVLDGDDIDAQIWEVDENLARSELTTEEQRRHVRRRKELWEEKQKERGKSLPTFQKASPGQLGFAAETAAATGLSKRRVNQLLADPKPRPEPKPAVLAADPLNDFESEERQYARLISAWNGAAQSVRERFLATVDRPVFDDTRAA